MSLSFIRFFILLQSSLMTAPAGIAQTAPRLIPYYQYGKTGPRFQLVDAGMKPVSEAWYESCFPENEGVAIVVVADANRDEFYGAVDVNGKTVIKPVFGRIGAFHDGLAPACMPGGKFGYIDRNGKWVISPRWEDAGEFRNGKAVVFVREKCGLIDKTGRMLTGALYDEFLWADRIPGGEGLAILHDKSRGWGLLDLNTLTETVPCRWDQLKLNFSEGMIPAQKGNMWGFVSRKGKVMTPFVYEEVEGFSEGLALVKRDGKWGYLGLDGKPAIPFRYSYGSSFCEGMAVVFSDSVNKWMWIGQDGAMFRQFPREQFHSFGNFSEGRISFSVRDDEGKVVWGFLDHMGKIAIPPQFGSVEPFHEGRAVVYGNSILNHTLCGLIDPFGEPLTLIKFNRLYPVEGWEGTLWYCESGMSLMSTPVIDREGREYFTGRRND